MSEEVGEEVILHTRFVKRPGIFGETQQVYNANPYWEPEKHPILNREMQDGIRLYKKNLS